MSRFIYRLASFLSTWQGFLATFVALLVGIGIGASLQFSETFMFGFNLLLSLAAIVLSEIILVAGARSEAAVHVKLDYLIEFSKAKNTAVGIEHKDVREIEAERKKIEKAAAEDLEAAVEEEVAEQLDRRK